MPRMIKRAGYTVRTVADLEPFSEECEEHGEVDGAGGLVHHCLQVLISRVLHIGSCYFQTRYKAVFRIRILP
jgi:hypothetical protein